MIFSGIAAIWNVYYKQMALGEVKEDAPTVETETVRRGKWSKWYGVFQCSECSNFFAQQYNYCPNCGVRMSEENDKV